MEARRARWTAWSLFGLSIVLAVMGALLHLRAKPMSPDLDYGVPFSGVFLAFTAVGAVIAVRRGANLIGWLLLAEGLLWEFAGVAAGYVNDALLAEPGSLPAGSLAAWVLSWSWIPTLGLIPFLFVLFPGGRTRSRAAQLIMGVTGVGVALAFLGQALAPGPMANARPIVNPYGLQGAKAILADIEAAGTFLLTVGIIASIVYLVVRFRRVVGTERLQLKWLVCAGGLVAVAFSAGNVLRASGLPVLADIVSVPSLIAIPVAMAVAILRHRLYDIDVVISKTVVFGGLAAFITAVYLAIVVGIGTAVGRGAGSNLALAVVATALVAVAFQPLRERLQRLARRLVFGRPTPAELHAGVAIASLGAFRVLRDGGVVPPSAWQSKKARTLLKILIARRGRSAPREFLMEALWPGEPPDLVTRRLSVAMTTIRTVLDPDKRYLPDHFVIGDRDAVRLDVTTLPIDVEQFLGAADGALESGGDDRLNRDRAKLVAAEEAYTGDFLEEDPYEDWATPLREEARAMYVAVVRALGALAESTGDIDDAIRYDLRVLEKDPWDEGAHLALVGVLERAGRHGEARRCYRTYASRMEELCVPAAPFPSSDPA